MPSVVGKISVPSVSSVVFLVPTDSVKNPKPYNVCLRTVIGPSWGLVCAIRAVSGLYNQVEPRAQHVAQAVHQVDAHGVHPGLNACDVARGDAGAPCQL